MTQRNPPSPAPDAAAEQLRELLCFNFYLGWRAIQAFYKPNFDAGMNPQRIYALAVCDADRGTTVSQIAAALQIELPAVSALVDRMEADGLVERRRSDHDRRTVEVFLTRLGVSSRARHDELLRKADEQLFAEHVRPKDLIALRRIVSGLSKSIAAPEP
ncbi:MAG: MarR family winged helix-turn-helix transcriptional regulator [Phycisphaerales bacterium]